ncbi:MAG: DNA polymerase III subunit delta, partial [Pseudomonadota bacterium]
HLVNAIKPILDLPPTDAVVVIEGADLKKTAPLRKAVEKAPAAAALPCYQDQAAALQRMVDEELNNFGLTIDPNARATLLSNLGDDRMASRSEVRKLCLYAMNAGAISENDVIELVGDAAAISTDAIVDAASLGQLAVVERDLRRLLDREASSFSLLNAAHRHFQTLHLLATRASAQRVAARSLVSSMRPPVIFSRRNQVERALDNWTARGLLHVTTRLDRAVLESRANDALASEIVMQTFLFIASEARRQAKLR